MGLKVSLKVRIKQLFCKHDGSIGWSCCSQGINSKKGHWHVEYTCGDCGFTYGEWIKADKDEMEKLFENKFPEIK